MNMFDLSEADARDLSVMDQQIAAAEAELQAKQSSANAGDRAPDPVEDNPEPIETAPKPEPTPEDSSSTPVATKPPETPPKEEAKPVEEPKPDATKPQSAYAKEMERRDRSWKALNEEKAKIAQERATIEAERKAFQEAQDAAPVYTAEQYDQAAADADAKVTALEAAGKFDEAETEKAYAKGFRQDAANLRANPPDVQKQRAREAAQLSQSHARSWAAVMAELPEVKQVGSKLNQEALKIVNEDPHVWNIHPNAPVVVARMARDRLQAARVPELEQGLTKAKARIAELEKLTSPAPGGGPTNTRTGPPPETEASLLAAMRDADGA